ncbi:MAG: amidohydrolase family protein, partial [Acidobacteria bacterium]|nr:amidohydrolase family protein [Acidobacteriota bacterium]
TMPLEQVNRLRKEIGEGKLLAPRIFANGPIVDGPKSVAPSALVVTNETEARRAVNSLKQRGADFIKVYNNLSRVTYFAIADEAKKQGIPFAGHVPYAVSAAEAADAGQKSFEHLASPNGGLLLACSSNETEVRKQWVNVVTSPEATAEEIRSVLNASIPQFLETYNEQKARQLIHKLVENSTWQCPTLTVLRGFTFFDDSSRYDDPRLKYLTRSEREGRDPKNIPWLRNRTPEMRANDKRLYQKNLELVGAMRRAGVEFLAGTDTPGQLLVPGFSLHDELALLVKAGLTPLEALQSATLNPAKFFDMQDSLGTVERGKIADLVLLEANPLENIANTQRISSVVVNGRYLPKGTLQKMLAEVEAVANK